MKKLLILICLLTSISYGATGLVTRIRVLCSDGLARSVDVQGWTIEYNESNYTGSAIALGVGSNGIVTSGRIVCNGADIEASSPYRGLILCNTNSQKYIIGIDDNGALYTELISSSPEISFSNRVDKINEKLNNRNIGRRGSKRYKETNLIVDSNDWIDIHSNLNVKIKVEDGDKVFINCTLYGIANSNKMIRSTYFLNNDNQGGNTHGFAYTDSQIISYIGFTDMSTELTNGTYWIRPMIKGKGTIISDNIGAHLTFMVIEKTQ